MSFRRHSNAVFKRRTILDFAKLNSIESEIALKKLLFLGRLITGQKMTLVSRSLFKLRSKSLFDVYIVPSEILSSICEALHKFDLFHYFDKWF